MADTSVSMRAALLASVPLTVIGLALPAAVYALFWGAVPYNGFDRLIEVHWVALAVAVVGSIFAHELLHILAFRVFGGVPLHQIRLGVYWPALMPYANTSARLTARAYRMVIALPGVVLGVLPIVIAIMVANGALLWYGALMLSAAAGDAVALWALRNVPGERYVVDCVDRVGCTVVD